MANSAPRSSNNLMILSVKLIEWIELGLDHLGSKVITKFLSFQWIQAIRARDIFLPNSVISKWILPIWYNTWFLPVSLLSPWISSKICVIASGSKKNNYNVKTNKENEIQFCGRTEQTEYFPVALEKST